MADYLEFVKTGIQTLIERQSARLGNRPDGTLCITVSRKPYRTWRAVSRQGDTLRSGLYEEQTLEKGASRLDLNVWPVLELFSDVTGDPLYRQMVVEMASVFGRHGFDPPSGLGYLGVEAQFDVLRREAVPASNYTKEPIFKPSSDLPIDRLWAEAPEQTARMFKSAYYGLITRPERMDYNRYCSYGFDDREKKPSMPFKSGHVAFALTGATLIHWWGFHFARTGDAECLAWAQAMADKWGAAQHPETGLIPHCFGGDPSGGPTQPPWPYIESGETTTATILLQAAGELKKHPEGAGLAQQVADTARRLLKGMARYGYDPQERVFPRWLYLDGQVRKEMTCYCFYSQAEKDEAVKLDPILREVAVYPGAGLYTVGPWSAGAENSFPYDITLGAFLTGDAELLVRAQAFAADVVGEAEKLASEFNALGQWIFPASASYVKMLLLLYKMTQDNQYLDWARKLADRELALLSQPGPDHPEWWRMPFRNSLLEALLHLHQELTGSLKP